MVYSTKVCDVRGGVGGGRGRKVGVCCNITMSKKSRRGQQAAPRLCACVYHADIDHTVEPHDGKCVTVGSKSTDAEGRVAAVLTTGPLG
jgi:hypothetical protein